MFEYAKQILSTRPTPPTGANGERKTKTENSLWAESLVY